MSYKNFETLLGTINSVAECTLKDAMVNWWMANDEDDALSQIRSNPGQDLAGIKNSVKSGLTSLANSLSIEPEALISEERLDVLADASAEDIIKALDEIHKQWIEDNFTPDRWAEKYFKGQLFQYRKITKLPWSEVEKDLLFINEYLKKGGNTVTEEELQQAFINAADTNPCDDDLPFIFETAYSFSKEIMLSLINFIEKLSKSNKRNDQERLVEVADFLVRHPDGNDIIKTMLTSVK